VDGESRPRIEHRSPSRTVRWYLVTGLTGLFLLSVGAFVVLVGRDIEPDTLLFEGAKVLPQIALVTVIGAALSVLSYEYQQRRKEEEKERDELRRQEEYRQELRRATLAQATASYLQVKRARRLLRVGLADDRRAIQAADYDRQMAAIMDAQLQFETLTDEVLTTADVFTSHDLLSSELKRIDDHLSALISEYEKVRPGSRAKHASIPLSKLPSLKKFLAQHAEDRQGFKQGFEPLKSSFIKVQELIRRDLLPPGPERAP
jgi:hypothetical protein